MTGRATNGHFTKGNQIAKGHKAGNCGRKRRVEEDEIKAALDASCGEAGIKDIVDVLYARAKAGEGWAVTLFLAYRWGKPQDHVDFTSNGASLLDYIKELRNGGLADVPAQA